MGAILSTASTSLSTVASSASSFDPRSLDAVKLATKNGDAAATRKVAQQFESMFLSMMLKNMRATLPGSDPLANDASKMATDMYDQQLAQNIASKGRGIGLADALVAQIERAQGKKPGTGIDALSSSPASHPVLTMPKLRNISLDATTASASPGSSASGTGVAATAPATATPVHRDFVDRFKDAAIAAAEASGIPAKIILGQAALESGWGKHEVRDSKGAGSFNLFGIKAGANWTGATVDAVTTEVVNGVAQKVVQKFRAYASYAESFIDYAKLVANNPRYEKAVHAAGDALQFAREMGRSGYATDPNYGTKLAQVLAGPLGKLF
ncbi:MAG: flagellar assembly peptidoglycan hydrolase FlgJ [Burkholderiaceae bacterium]